MFTYKQGKAVDAAILVRLDGKLVGHIKKIYLDGSIEVPNPNPKNKYTIGYAYYPKGVKFHGDIFKSIELVKKSIEEE